MNKLFTLGRSLLTVLLTTWCLGSLQAQTIHESYAGSSSNVFPFATTSSNKVEWIYLANDFTPAVTGGYITKVSFYAPNISNGTTTFTDLLLEMDVTTDVTLVSGPYASGMKVVYSEPSTTVNVTGGWWTIELQTPFYWNGTDNLRMRGSQLAYSTGLNVYNYSNNGNKRLYGSASATSGTAGAGLPQIRLEIDPQGPLVGANDAAVEKLIEPESACVGLNPIKVKIANRGSNDITYLRVDYEIDGVRQQGYTISRSVLYANGSQTGPSDTVLYLTNYNLTSAGARFKVWTSNPNTFKDTINSNDTLIFDLVPGMEGNYTINQYAPATRTNYQSFTKFAKALDSLGVCGHIYVDVAPGTYTERPEFSRLKTSASKTITINGHGQAILQFNSSTGTNNNAVLTLDASPYITIDSLHIRNFSSGSYGSGLLVVNSSNVTFKNGSIYVDTSATSSLTQAIGLSSATSSMTSTGGSNHYFTLENSEIVGGYYGLYMYGSSTDTLTGVKIRNNIFRNQYYYGIYSYYTRDLEYTYNDLSRPNRTNNNYFYVGNIYYSNRLTFSHNKFHHLYDASQTGTTYDYGLYIYYSYGEPNKPTKIYNNLFSSESSYTAYGLRVYYGRYNHIMNNTIILTENPNRGTAGTFYGLYHYVTNSTSYMKNVVKNNNVYIKRSANSGTTYGVYFYDGGQSISSTNRPDIDNNNVFIDGGATNYYYYSSTSHTTYAAYKTNANSRGGEYNGLNVNPQFVSITNGSVDATPQNTALQGAAEAISFINDDINLQARNALPTIGAVEMNPASCLRPGNLLAYNITNNSGAISWDPIPGVTGYEYAYNTTGTPPGSGTSTTNTSVNLTGLTNNTLYYYYVRTRCSGSINSAWSIDTFRTFTNACNPPSNLQINAGSTRVDLTWTNSTSTTSHQYYVSPTRTVRTTGFSTSTNGTGSVTGLSPNTKYYVYVRANCSSTQQSLWLLDSFTTCFVDNAILSPNAWHGCTDDTVVIKAPPHSSYNYQWYNGANAISGATNSVLIVTTSGNYNAKMTSTARSACSKQTDTLALTINAKPVIDIDTIGGTNQFCIGDSIIIKTQAGHNYTYQWYLGRNMPIPGETNDSIVVKSTGLYKVVVEVNGCKDSSDLIFASMSQVPSTDLTFSGPLEFCEGDSVLIMGTPVLGVNYQWYLNNTPAPAGNGSTLIAKQTGRYYLHASFTPCSGASVYVDVLVNPAPNPIITDNGNGILTAPTGFASYQWYFNGAPVGTNSNTYNAGANYGFYSVTVEDATTNCKGISENYYYRPASVVDIASGNLINIYPNPTNGMVFLETNEDITYDVMAVDGKFIYSQSTSKSFDLSNYAPGIYTIRIYNNDGVLIATEKVTKK